MPSKQDQCFVVNGSNSDELQSDYLARDVEELASEIKENLRLKAKPQRSTQARRPSPYNKADRITARKEQTPQPPAIEDPYGMLQHLLDSNSLVAEAVRRLQEGLSPKQRFFYDDEDEFPLLNCPLGV